MQNNSPTPDRGDVYLAMWHGLLGRCPRCGRGSLFNRYLKPTATCGHCGEHFDRIRTDDIAPYFTILVVGHLTVPLILSVERLYAPPVWVHWIVWPALAVLLSLLTLPRLKGAVLAWMWCLGLRGDEQH